MRTLISLGMAAFVLSFIFSADLFAEEEWEKELKADGWVKVGQKLIDQADTTWYGTKFRAVKFQSYEEWVFYIDPSGKNIFMKIRGTNLTDTGIREETKDGLCISWKHGGGETWNRGKIRRCGRTLWKKENLYMTVSPVGFQIRRWTIKKGNLEKL